MRRISEDQYVEPKNFSKSFSILTLVQRKKLQELLEKKTPIKQIALKLDMSRSTIYFERMRMGSLEIPYDAETAHKDAHEKGKVRNSQRVELPLSYKQNISLVYRIIKTLLKENISTSLSLELRKCLVLLEKMGADPEKMRKKITAKDIQEILDLHEKGLTLLEIQVETDRAKSTIQSIIKKHKEEKTEKTTQEISYEHIKNKWLS